MESHPIAPPEHTFRVTYHAITRYIQRILCVVVETEEGMSYKAVAQAHCKAISKSMDEVKAIILCPAVIAACMVGMTTVTTRSFRAVITPVTGVVVTISEPKRAHRKRRRLQIMTRRESHQTAKEHTRRLKRKPSVRLAREPEDVG